MTNFNWAIDGSIVGIYLLVTMIAGIMVRKYVGKVEDFLVAGREMNLYLGIASLAATEFGIVTAMYVAQAGYTKGFSGAIPGICQAIAMLAVGLTGFCVKKLRDSGAMTLPELFQNRYGTQVRWLAGVVIVLGGLLNMGAFLRLGGEFLVVCCGFKLENLVWMMTAMLLAVAIYTIMGGMLSVLVTDFLQFVVMSIGLHFAVVCFDAVPYPAERQELREELAKAGKTIIPITLEQMHRYVGNMLELRAGREGSEAFVFLSETAFQALRPDQRIALEQYAQLVPVAIPTIEAVGGGSVRCMLAEVFLPSAIRR